MAVIIDKLDAEIRQNLDIYMANTMDDVRIAIEETAKETVSYLRKNSPVRKKSGGGTYAKNWSRGTYKRKGMWFGSTIVYNKPPTYRLTHLLEKEHASRNGGRVSGNPHIMPAQEAAYTILRAKLLRSLRYRD